MMYWISGYKDTKILVHNGFSSDISDKIFWKHEWDGILCEAPILLGCDLVLQDGNYNCLDFSVQVLIGYWFITYYNPFLYLMWNQIVKQNNILAVVHVFFTNFVTIHGGSRGSGALGPRCWVGDGEQLGEMACFAEGKQICYLYWYQNSSFDLSIMKNIRIHYTHLLGCKQRIINVQQGWRLWSLWISCWGGEGPLNVC